MKIQCSDGKEATLDFNPEHKKIGVMLSGGMDSALLLYLILQHKPRYLELEVYNVPNPKDNARYFSNKVIDWIEKNLGCPPINITNLESKNLSPSTLIFQPGILRKGLVDRLYSASNQNPPHLLEGAPWRRSPYLIQEDNSHFPFITLYKKHILEIYLKYNIIDLAYITSSCTESTDLRCNTCFQCKERAWAFECLGIDDKGIN